MITPLHYSLSLDPLIEQRSFSGEVSIEVAVGGPGDRIVLDSAGLDIGETTVDGRTASVEIVGDRLSLHPSVPLRESRATVHIAFRGRLHRGTRGLFVSGACAVTQLQPVYARMLFPCFDDPACKTTFDVTVSADRSHTIVSNAPVLRDEPAGDRHRVTFERSPSIPTHLFGLAIGPFHMSGLDVDGLPVRLFSLRSDGAGQPVLEAVRDFLRFYTGFLGVPYPWPKLDLVVVPEFEAAGIETTSVLFFRESALLGHRRMAALVAHELAHQWFGSLVTPSSWQDLWLNEGFATWLSAKAVAERDGDVDDVESVRSIRAVMTADSLPSSRPLRMAGQEAAELHELYDEIVYWKGAAVLRMLEAWLGQDRFRRGVTVFLTSHANGHATAADLWRALEAGSVSPIAPMIHFVDRAGVPALRLSCSGSVVRITRVDGETGAIPIAIKAGLADGSVETRKVLLAEASCSLRMPDDVAWVFGNAGAAGYYRCSYDDVQAVPSVHLTGPEAVVLLSDAWDELWSGGGDIIGYLVFLESIGARPEVSDTAASHIGEIASLLAKGARHDPFEHWISNRFPRRSEDPRKNVAGFTNLRDDEVVAHFERLLIDPATQSAAWHQLKANWDELRGRVVSFGGRGAIPALAAVSDRATRDDIARFFDGRATGGAERVLRQTLEKIDGRIQFREREQLMFDAWLTRQASSSPALVEPLRQPHALLNMLASGFHGALVHRAWLDGLGISPSEWMQPPEELAQVVTALERRLIALFRGKAAIDPPLMALSARLQEDLLASSDHAARLLDGAALSNESAKALAAVLARQAAVFERLLRGAIAFTDLSGDEEGARLLRTRLRSTTGDRSRIRVLLDQVARGALTDTVRGLLRTECASIPSVQKSQAGDVATLVTAIATNRSRPSERDS